MSESDNDNQNFIYTEREKNQKIFDMWLASYTQDEIAEAVKMTQQAIDKRLKELQLLENFPKVVKLAATYADDFEIPIYNV